MELFSGLPRAVLEDVSACARQEYVAKGHLIFPQGGRAERAYALGEGSARIVQTGSDGGQVVIRFIGAGEMFGTIPLFTDHIFPADAIAAERALVISWSEAEIMRLLETCPQAALNVIRIIGARLAEVQNRVRELSTQGVERRIAHALLRLVDQAGRPTGDGAQIDLRLRRQDLAEVSGTTLHTASRLLASWEKAGHIASQRQRLTVRDLSWLRRIANGAQT
jgi:CRP-like cAMP-binding protein